MNGQKNLLDPKVLAALGTLKLRARAVAEGVLTGLHKSPHHGQSVEFAEHKEYAPGDDVRRIDWKAYGKFDKYYVKQFEQETNLRCYLVVDASGSMAYRSDPAGMTKLEYASALAASLAYLLVRQQDAAGLVVVDDKVVRTVPPRAAASHLPALVETLSALEAKGTTSLGAAVDHIVERAKRRASVIVFSDLFDWSATAPPGRGRSGEAAEQMNNDRVLKKLAQLRLRHHEVTLFHVLDPAELAFPFEDPTLFLSMEDERQVEAHGRDIKKGYLELMHRWLAEVKRSAAEHDIDYGLCPTDRPLDRVLVPFLARREAGVGRTRAGATR